jgi:hypothetical protein
MPEAEESCPPDMRTCHRAGHKRDVGALLERNDWASVRRIPSTFIAVCLLPGTELAFEENVQYERAFTLFGRACMDHKVARFRQVNMNDPHVHHDALEFPNGQIVMVTRLVAGQRATVLQLPASTRDHSGAKENARLGSAGRIEA